MIDSKEVLELLDKPVDVRRLIKELAFDLENFEEANRMQPRLFLEAGRYLTSAVLQKSKTENKLETMIAETGLKLRREKIKGKNSLTDKGIIDMVNGNPEVATLKNRFAITKAMEVWAKQLLEAYNHRLTVLSNITRIRTGEMATQLREVKEKAAVDDMRRRADKVRRSMEDE